MSVKKQQNQNAKLVTQNDNFKVVKTRDSEQETARRHDVRSEYIKVSCPVSPVSAILVPSSESSSGSDEKVRGQTQNVGQA